MIPISEHIGGINNFDEIEGIYHLKYIKQSNTFKDGVIFKTRTGATWPMKSPTNTFTPNNCYILEIKKGVVIKIHANTTRKWYR